MNTDKTKSANRVVASVLAFLLTFSMGPGWAAFADPAGEPPQSQDSTQAVTPQTEGWTQNGTCEWQIDDDGVLTMRPKFGDRGQFDSNWSDPYDPLPGSEEGSDLRHSVTAVIIEPGVEAPSDCSFFFSFLHIDYSIDLTNFDTSHTSKMNSMFKGCWAEELTLAHFKTLQVTDMSSMFEDSRVRGLDLSSFNTVNVTDMSAMFKGTQFLSFPPIEDLDTSHVTDMSSMFESSAAKSLDLRSINTSQVTNMSKMFYYCADLTALDFSNFDTSQVTDMSGMFYICTGLKSMNLSSFDTSRVTNMSSMFEECYGLISLDLSSFDTGNTEDMSMMFGTCGSLTSLNLSNFKTSKVKKMNSMFINCMEITSIDVSSFDTSQVTNMVAMFANCDKLASLDLSNFDTSQVTDMTGMVSSCDVLASLNLVNFDTSQETNMKNMFQACPALSEIVLGSKFSFQSDAKLADAPADATYTGNWVIRDRTEQGVTAADLLANYPNAEAGYPVGTYVWETQVVPDTYSVTYTVDGDVPAGYTAPIDTTKYLEGDTVVLAGKPSADGYTFDGWKLNGSVVTAPSVGTANIELTGTWTIIPTYSVTYSVSGDVPAGYTVPVDTTKYLKGDTVVLAGKPSAAGYTFDGWKLNGTVVTALSMGTANIELTGVWKKNEKPAPHGLTVTRLFGGSRSGTSAAIANNPLVSNPAAERAIIVATSANYPDALAAASLAGAYNADVVLTDGNTLSPECKQALIDSAAQKVFIVGGNNAVSAAVEKQIVALKSDVTRIGGSSRSETARLVAVNSQAVKPSSTKTCIIASSANFPDALSASAYAAYTSSPIFLAESDGRSLSDAVIKQIKTGGYTSAIVVGGQSAIAETAVKQIKTQAGVADVSRLGGANRYETAALIAQYETSAKVGMTYDRVGIATGEKFPDALCGGAYQGRDGSVIILTPSTSLADSCATALNWNEAEINEMRFFGGTSSVSGDVIHSAVSLIKHANGDITWNPVSSALF